MARCSSVEWMRAWRAANPERAKAISRKNNLRLRYGLTPEQFDDMLVAQCGRCAVCADPLLTLHIDHDRATGAVRGLLCRNCNWLIGHSREREEVLLAAVRYLQDNKAHDPRL